MIENEYVAAKALNALNQAALAIGSELDSEKVLQIIVDAARDMVGARYAALGVPTETGKLGQFIHSGLSRREAALIAHPPEGRGLLGAISSEGSSIRVKRISEDPQSVGFPEGHVPMTSFMGVPIVGARRHIGILYLTDKIVGEGFSESDQKLVEMLAAHAAIAIQNAQLYEQVERLAVLEERARIGMDLHDGVIQSIYAVGLTLESTRLALEGQDEELVQLLDSAVAGLNDAIRDIRNFILDLRPRRFSGDLTQGLARLVREFQANTMVPVSVYSPDNLADIPTLQAQALFLATQETLANIARHARAENVTMTIQRTGSTIAIQVVDDGLGFYPTDDTSRVGHGLANMQERAKGLGGTFKIRSKPGRGTSIRLQLPI